MASRVLASRLMSSVRGAQRSCMRRFHNGPPRNPDGENPWPYVQQKLFFASGFGVCSLMLAMAYASDLFKPKFGEIDWDKIRAERNALVDEAAEPEDEDDEDDEEEDEEDEDDE